jgi:hypothetical protein
MLTQFMILASISTNDRREYILVAHTISNVIIINGN